MVRTSDYSFGLTSGLSQPRGRLLRTQTLLVEESVKTDANARWLVSSGVRSTYSEDGAVLLDIGKGLCYSLNKVAARIWVTIETCQAGITLGGIVDALETHFEAPREELGQVGLARWNGHRGASKVAGGGS